MMVWLLLEEGQRPVGYKIIRAYTLRLLRIQVLSFGVLMLRLQYLGVRVYHDHGTVLNDLRFETRRRGTAGFRVPDKSEQTYTPNPRPQIWWIKNDCHGHDEASVKTYPDSESTPREF